MKYSSIVILTGAGISAESGIKTFRDSDGLWENHKIEEVATPEGFIKNQKLVYEFYNQRRKQLREVEPNKAHIALAELEKNFKGRFTLITQNVDNLHDRAGSKNLIHMHGELLKARCQESGKIYDCTDNLDQSSKCDCCSPTNGLRPHIVWFGEMPLEMARITMELKRCNLFIAIGTSGNVYPAANFVRQAKLAGARAIEVNKETSQVYNHFDEHRYGLATELVPKLVEELLS
ncbi:MAG: Sir2 family NAD+-dependent deacetylase [Candidatus Caenarcaniphilales bacterium]|nr:Sir2 family NAD+-dependent deacetylase [Candidatus Caenarcaniphilales bacterium]